jgi:hypothetical protein
MSYPAARLMIIFASSFQLLGDFKMSPRFGKILVPDNVTARSFSYTWFYSCPLLAHMALIRKQIQLLGD